MIKYYVEEGPKLYRIDEKLLHVQYDSQKKEVIWSDGDIFTDQLDFYRQVIENTSGVYTIVSKEYLDKKIILKKLGEQDDICDPF